MASTFVTNNGTTTIKIEYTALTATVKSVVGDASEYLFEKGAGDHGTEETPIVFADLTSQEKLDLVDAHLKTVIVNLANTHKSIKAQNTARETEASTERVL